MTDKIEKSLPLAMASYLKARGGHAVIGDCAAARAASGEDNSPEFG